MNAFWQSLILLGMTGCYAAGGYWLNLFAKAMAGYGGLALSFAAYALGNGLYILILKTNGYGLSVVLSSVALCVFNLGVAVFILGERLSALQIMGACFALIGTTLIISPSLIKMSL